MEAEDAGKNKNGEPEKIETEEAVIEKGPVGKFIGFLLENSLILIFGAIVALTWANFDNESYKNLLHMVLLENPWIGELHDGHRIITLHYFINDICMAFFFAIAGKEVWEATLPGGPLNSPKTAATPLIATFGGMAGPALVYIAGAAVLGRFDELANGWAIPCATDIAFSYLVARIVFGKGHPAIPFLLLLAIADDALGLLILAVFYPQGEMQPVWMLLPVAAMLMSVGFRKMKLLSFWWYILIAGPVSWIGFAMSGLHPALGLLTIIPFIPNAGTDLGIFAEGEKVLSDELNKFEHWWKNPVELILGAFGLLNAGVILSSMGDTTGLVLGGLLLGKPLGIFLCGLVAVKVFRLDLPNGMNLRDLVVVGFAAGIGFTVALFVSTVAFPSGEIQDAAKMGALASFAAAVLTVVAARLLKVQKVVSD